jgi:hypothetical protein
MATFSLPANFSSLAISVGGVVTTDYATIASTWGSSVIGNSRTRDMFLQGMTNKIAFDIPTAGSFTIYATDDTTPLKTGTYTAAAVNPVTVLDPA